MNLNYLYEKKYLICFLLLPVAAIYFLIITLRKFLYRKNILKSFQFPVPVIVVGNLTLGGTGKTPLTIALVEYLKQQGYKPGVISRGYGSKAKQFPYHVTDESNTHLAGDEPLLIHLRTKVPVVIDPNRPNAAAALLKQYDCDMIISDDGLQHYALRRDIEIAVIDAKRKFGNGFLFPAGPLREPQSRLKSVDFVVCNGDICVPKGFAMQLIAMQLIPGEIINLKTNEVLKSPDFFANKNLIAIAGIGNPDRFFESLSQLGLRFGKQAMPDHYPYSEADFKFDKNQYYIMTEKDAVKCRTFANERMYYLPVSAEISTEFFKTIIGSRRCSAQSARNLPRSRSERQSTRKMR